MLDQSYWQEKLNQERQELENELAKVARVNPQNKTDWEMKPLENRETSFRDEVADELEELDEKQAVELALEQRLKEVRGALERLQTGKYGLCEIGGEPIEEAMLRVNPAARTCKAHLAEEKNLS